MGARGLVERPDLPAVADAGPLIHLSEIGQFRLLRLFSPLHVPSVVTAEAVRHGPVTDGDLTGLGIFKQHDVAEERIEALRTTSRLRRLQSGELACFALCRELGVSIVLCDDLAGRDAAIELVLTPVGSLGVIVRAFRGGLIARPEAERALADLYDVSTLFVTRTLVDIALEELARLAP